MLDTTGLTNTDLRAGAAGRRRRGHSHRAATGRRRPRPAHQGPALGRHLAGRPHRRRRAACPRRGAGARLLRVPLALRRPAGPAGRQGRARRAGRLGGPQGRRGAGARGGRRRLARPHAGAGAVEREDPRLAGRAGRRGRRPGPAEGPGLGREAARRGRLRRARRRRPGVREPAAAGPPGLRAPSRRAQGAARRAGRQGHHVRHRRPLDQVPRQHDADEARHDRRRRGARGDGGAGRRRLPGAGHRPARLRRELRRRPTRSGPATCCATTAAAPPRSPTPTPRAGW